MKLIKGIGNLFSDGFLMIVGLIVIIGALIVFDYVHYYVIVPIILIGFVIVGFIWMYWFIRWIVRTIKATYLESKDRKADS
ncbi:hypothetical protein [Peribacillus acanthi]|uniref:hypothetical protein n=1 Tax=Peribacillus acanthi TaxID=2171554 RepID=UPI000D3E9DA0|nr:hypothetical protein [Peribacillus acanthi]